MALDVHVQGVLVCCLAALERQFVLTLDDRSFTSTTRIVLGHSTLHLVVLDVKFFCSEHESYLVDRVTFYFYTQIIQWFVLKNDCHVCTF